MRTIEIVWSFLHATSKAHKLDYMDF